MRIAIATLVTAIGLGGAAVQEAGESFAIAQARGKAFEEGGFRAAAGVTGSYRQAMTPHGERNASTLRFLVENSRLILIGRIQKSRVWLNARGDYITTDYEVAVERPLKGAIESGDLVTMSVLGGRVVFPDGAWAEIETPGMTPPAERQTFILFLEPTDMSPAEDQRVAAHGPVYMPAFASHGMYCIDGGVIEPKVYAHHPLARTYAGRPETVLVNDVLDLIDARR